MQSPQTLDQSNPLEKFSESAKKAIIEAFEVAKNNNEVEVNATHLFVGLLKVKKGMASRLLSKLGVDVKGTIEVLSRPLNQITISPNFYPEIGELVQQLLVDAFVIAHDLSHVYVGTEHILLAILKLENADFVEDLKKAGFDYKSVFENLSNFATYHQGVFKKEQEGIEDMDGQKEKSALNVFAQNMNQLAESGRYLPVYGRNEEIERMIHILSRRTKSNPILVGDAGVGKTAIVEGLVQRILNKDVPASFQNKQIINLDIAGILAGSKIRGDVEERIIAIVREASENPDIILFVDEIHIIVGAGSAGQGSMDIANILKPHLTTGDISLIGATTLDEYQKYFESDNALSRRFQPIIVDEIAEDEAVKVLKNIVPKLEEYHHVKILDEAIDEAVKLSNRYITDRFLPDKAIDILDETSAGQKIVKEKVTNTVVNIQKEYDQIRNKKELALAKGKIEEAGIYRKREIELEKKIAANSKRKSSLSKDKYTVTSEQVRKIVSKITGVPVTKMDQNTVKALIGIEKTIGQRIIGQPDAIKRVAASLRRARVGIGDANRPLASFLFLGPTGVGKTELAKTIAVELFGDESALIQVDMSEYMEQHSVSKIIGSPPGYIGYQEGGQLTEKIRRKPYSVVLFDEIEKAHPDLLNIFLQILEEGHIQDSKGRKVNFKNTVIVMTSNIGAEEVSQDSTLGFSIDQNSSNDPKEEEMDEAFEEMRQSLLEELKNTLRPEMLNRIDEVIVFRGLSDKDAAQIVKLEIDKLNKRLMQRNVSVAVSKGAATHIAKEGFSKDYGARNIRRRIQELIENPLAELILKRNLGKTELEIVKVEKATKGLKLELTK